MWQYQRRDVRQAVNAFSGRVGKDFVCRLGRAGTNPGLITEYADAPASQVLVRAAKADQAPARRARGLIP
jgi:hypothetical protein